MTFLTNEQQAVMAKLSGTFSDAIAATSTFGALSDCMKIVPTVYLPTTELPTIRNVIFNNPATIIYWDDGTKTVVKCGENDVWDAEKGLAMAVAKKAMGNKGNYNRALKRWLEDRSERSKTTRSEMKATGG